MPSLLTCAEMYADHIVSSGSPHNNVLHFSSIIGASLSEPHIDELNVRNLYIIIIIIGASLSEPHIDELNVRNLYIIIIQHPFIVYVLLLHPITHAHHCSKVRMPSLLTCAEMYADHIVSSGSPHNNVLHFSSYYYYGTYVTRAPL